jgi:predicted HTH transcriptional regulator
LQAGLCSKLIDIYVYTTTDSTKHQFILEIERMPMVQSKKSIKEEFAKFFETPSRESLRNLLKNNLGEFPHCDFKGDWPIFSKIAKHILGMANSDGGCIIIGVSEEKDKTLENVGVENLKDKTVCINAFKKYLPVRLLKEVEILDFTYKDSEYGELIGKSFQVVFVTSNAKYLPFISLSSGEKIIENVIYTRRGPSTEPANYEELQKIINKRIDTDYSSKSELDLEEHLTQLKILYSYIDRYNVKIRGGIAEVAAKAFAQKISNIVGQQEKILNPIFPKEGFEDFVARVIEKKKRRIESELKVHKTQ